MVQQEFKSKVNYIIYVTLFVISLIAVFAIAPEVFLLVFAGILVSVFLLSLRDLLMKLTKLSPGIALTIVILTLTVVTTLTWVAVAPSIAEQFDELVKEIPKTFSSFQERLESYSWGKYLIDNVDSEKILKSQDVVGFKGFGGALSGLMGMVGNIVVILFIGLYGAADPKLYKKGLLSLIPPTKRKRIDEVMSELFETLKWWLVGQFFSMTVIGISTTIGLALLGVPLAFILGLIAATFTFIPNIGPVLAAVPAILLGLTIDPKVALYVTALYLGTQTVESYFLTPLVQQKTIDLPPALILATQVLFGLTLGMMGLALAAPLTAVIIVTTKMLYVDDYLGGSDK